MKKCSKDPSLSDPGIFSDPFLLPHADVIRDRLARTRALEKKRFNADGKALAGVDDYHLVFGLHPDGTDWVFREWAPNARKIFILCEKNGWEKSPEFRVPMGDDGIFEARFPGAYFAHRDLFRLKVVWPGGEGDRIPTAATRVVQDPDTLIFNAQVWHPDPSYVWKCPQFVPGRDPLLIYEAHPGMALEAERIGTWTEFRRHILPKIIHAGYNTIQLMAVQEHPYYGSFGYHVSSFFAPSSRFGTPEELKQLVDAAHENGIRVLMDIVHSHSVKNEVEGLSRFDGTAHQFFHDGPRGEHRLWDSRCFDYGKPMVVRFLLSNLRYWTETFRMDGFRFDGITSMLFADHGLGRAFTSYADYYGPDVDTDALAYLSCANRLVHGISPSAVTIAEDVSGYPGLAGSRETGGTGFDFRFAMGMADFWIKLLKEVRDEEWPMGTLWHELTTRRKEEATISYAECHDQALVGDQTLMMHLMGGQIYTAMERTNTDIRTVRAVALHKMIRLITLATANAGYLNFMGNEFGHPEWVDFPSRQNNFSYHYARRLWSLKYDPALYYSTLFEFDRRMVDLAKREPLFETPAPGLLHVHDADKVIAFERSSLVFAFNFNPVQSFADYHLDAPAGKYRLLLHTDAPEFGGRDRLDTDQVYFTWHLADTDRNRLSLYLPSRCALVLKRLE